MLLHFCSTALCSSSSAACLGPEIPAHTSGTSGMHSQDWAVFLCSPSVLLGINIYHDR